MQRATFNRKGVMCLRCGVAIACSANMTRLPRRVDRILLYLSGAAEATGRPLWAYANSFDQSGASGTRVRLYPGSFNNG